MDKLDKKIIQLLSEDARKSYQEIARACGISGVAIQQRVKKLHANGIMLGSKLLFNHKLLGFTTQAFIGIILENGTHYEKVIERIQELPEAVEVNFTAGRFSLIVKIICRDNDHLKEILSQDIQQIEGIARTETFVVLDQALEREVVVA